jgi:hypothetical protein
MIMRGQAGGQMGSVMLPVLLRNACMPAAVERLSQARFWQAACRERKKKWHWVLGAHVPSWT